MAKTQAKRVARYRRQKHIQKTVRGTAERPRLSVFRSANTSTVRSLTTRAARRWRRRPGENSKRVSAAATVRVRKRSVRRSVRPPRRQRLSRWFSTVTDTSIMAELRRWQMQRAKPA